MLQQINEGTKTHKLFTRLKKGEKITVAQAKALGIKNVSAEISRIRQAGYAVYANTRTTKTGTVTEYSLGIPSRKLVAAGYRAIQLGLA